jgi:hypothetical protein
MTGIWSPMVMSKKSCQRLTDPTSSLRWDLICPIHLIGLKKRICLGISSFWDSRPTIYVRSTESSTVDTMCCCECRFNCSTWREETSKSLSCHIRPDVSLTSADVRPEVIWRSWRNCGKHNSHQKIYPKILSEEKPDEIQRKWCIIRVYKKTTYKIFTQLHLSNIPH